MSENRIMIKGVSITFKRNEDGDIETARLGNKIGLGVSGVWVDLAYENVNGEIFILSPLIDTSGICINLGDNREDASDDLRLYRKKGAFYSYTTGNQFKEDFVKCFYDGDGKDDLGRPYYEIKPEVRTLIERAISKEARNILDEVD